MNRLLIGLALTAAMASCAPAIKKLTPMPGHVVKPSADWKNAEDEDEMDPLIPGYNPLTSKDPTDQLLSKFRGVDRKGAKTTIASASMETFASIEALIKSLPDDNAMLNHTPEIERDTDTRAIEEKRNVRVTCWVYAIKYESDQDWHVILGSSPSTPVASRVYFNAEVSGLPGNTAPAYNKLKKVRKTLAELFDYDLPGVSDYYEYFPFGVVVEGSLFYDVDHSPGSVGPEATRPTTAWEIHPITKLRAQ